MQTVGSQLLAILESSERDLSEVDLFEFYAPTVTDLCPGNAAKLYAATELKWLGWLYEREGLSRGDISRYIDGRFNTVDLTLSNVDRTVSSWLSQIQLEGYRVRIRCISRSVPDDSIVLGVFRCEKAVDVDNRTVRISAKQDLGSVENDLPWTKIQIRCVVKFKGLECLGGQTLAQKSAAYQAATVCNKSKRQCYDDYLNGPSFQGEFFNAVTGNFRVSKPRGGAGGAALSLIGLRNKRVTKQYSSQDATSQGQAVTLGLGRTQIELTPLQFADTGEYLAGQWLIGEGPIQSILNLRNVSPGWASTFQALSTHRGEYGHDPEQQPHGFFASQNQYHSHRAYVEATIKGDNPDTGDPAPTLAAVIMWIKIPVWNGSSFSSVDWSDNPVEHVRFLLTEGRSLNYSTAWIDDTVAGETREYCNEPLIDQSGGEDVYISTASGTPGTTYKRYRSTGIRDKYYFRKLLGLTSQHSAEREATVTTYNPATAISPTPSTYYRKRWTSNWHVIDYTRVTDFLFKELLACARLFLITSAQGKVQIRAKKPAITSYLRSSASAGGTTIAVEDVLAWRNLNLPFLFALIGVGGGTSETRKVTAADFSTAGNSITLSASGSASASGSTFSGGTTTVQAWGQIRVNSVGNATVTIDGVASSYTSGVDDTTGTIAAGLADRINANLTLNRYVSATWSPTNPTVVYLRSKLGNLTLATGLEFSHVALEVVAQVHLPFSDVAFGALTRGNISVDGFRWPLGSKQSSHNQFVIEFNDAPQDYQLTRIEENDYDHQELVNKINKLDVPGGGCVDNYHQANRLLLAERYEKREGDYFVQITTTDGRALLLEEGDIICAKHDNQPLQRNLLFRIEELKVSQEHKVTLVARLYADAQFPTAAEERTIQLTTGIGWMSTPPEAITNYFLEALDSTTVRGTFKFAGYIGTQEARVEVKRTGEPDYSDTGIRVTPDSSDNGQFEVSGLPSGINWFRVTPFSSAGDGPSSELAIDTSGNGDLILEWQTFGRPEPILEVEVFS